MSDGVLPVYPPGGGGLSNPENKLIQPFYNGEMVFMRSKRISKADVKRIYDTYASLLDLDVWWVYVVPRYNNQLDIAKDSDDDSGYYLFHTKYVGRVKGPRVISTTGGSAHLGEMFTVEWEAREGTLMPGEHYTRLQDHYAENLISMSKMTVMTKEEIVAEITK